jgi:hypothetical protein
MIPCKELMHTLVESHANDGVGDFKLNQSHLGFNLVPQGLLMSEHRDKVFDGICYDWMHIYAVSGIFQREIGMLLGKLHRMKPAPLKQANLHGVVSSFTPPAYLRGSTRYVLTVLLQPYESRHE